MSSPTSTSRLVVLVGKDQNTNGRLATSLESEGYRTESIGEISAAWRSVIQEKPFAAVVDTSVGNAPWLLDFCRGLAEYGNVLVIVLEDGDSRRSRAKALSSGVDQVLATPGCIRELVAYLNAQRVRHQSEPAAAQNGTVDSESDITLDQASHRVYRNGQAINLSRIEFALLSKLARSRTTVESGDIYRSIWKSRNPDSGRALLKQYIARLRRKIEPDPHRPIHLETIRGVGYRFHPRSHTG